MTCTAGGLEKDDLCSSNLFKVCKLVKVCDKQIVRHCKQETKQEKVSGSSLHSTEGIWQSHQQASALPQQQPQLCSVTVGDVTDGIKNR